MSFFNNQGKLKFEVKFEVNELANVPLVNGFLFTKWKLAAGGASGVTNRFLLPLLLSFQFYIDTFFILLLFFASFLKGKSSKA